MVGFFVDFISRHLSNKNMRLTCEKQTKALLKFRDGSLKLS